MLKRITEDDFHAMFISSDMGHSKFSMLGRTALFEYFEEMEDASGTQMIINVVEVCCDWAEYDSVHNYNECYGTEHRDWDDVRADAEVILVQPASLVDDEPAIVRIH